MKKISLGVGVLILAATAVLLAQATRIISSGTLPASCSVGNIYVKTGAGIGFYACTAANTWTGPLGTAFGAASSTDEALARFDGTGGKTLQNGAITMSDTGALTFPDGVKQTFNPDGTNAGVNVGSQAGDPGSPANGDLWYDSTANELTARINGASVALGAGGGGGGWTLECTITNGGTDDDCTTLDDYGEVLIIFAGVSTSSNSNIHIRVSTDNGMTFLSSAGDYRALAYDDPVGAATVTTMPTTNASTTSARWGWRTILAFNGTGPKVSSPGPTVGKGAAACCDFFIPTTTPLNAIRIMTNAGSGITFSAGTTYVYGR